MLHACRCPAAASPQVFKDQQTKFRAMLEGAKAIPVPVDGDAAAIAKFQSAYEALRKKARGCRASRRPHAPGARQRAAFRVFAEP